MKHLEQNRLLKTFYNQFWEEKISHRNLVNYLINLEDHLEYIQTPNVVRLNSVVSTPGYKSYIRNKIRRTKTLIKRHKDSIRFIKGKIRLHSKKFPLG